MFDHYLRCWNLTPDGEPITTPTSGLLPVRRGSLAAMLKIALIEEERRGNRLMARWAGRGAALVLEYEEDAILMERAEAGPSLAALARNHGDDEASRIICSVAARLHAAGEQPPPPLLPLADWFAALPRAAAARGGVLLVAARIASELLASPREPAVLHGTCITGTY
jgi:streptomycin 6-kinase